MYMYAYVARVASIATEKDEYELECNRTVLPSIFVVFQLVFVLLGRYILAILQ